MSEQTIDIQSTDGTGTFSAYVAYPPSGKGPALVICQEIFGVNATMREIADGYAREGFVAVVPDLFWRLEPGVQLDYTPDGWQKAFGFFQNFDQDVGAQDIAATLRDARALPACEDHHKAGVVGYCLGGKMAYLAACRTDAAVSVGYYGTGIENKLDELDNIQGQLVLHFAGNDEYCPPEAQEKIRAAMAGRANVTVYDYPGVQHAFSRPRGDHFDAAADKLARERTLQALRDALA